jgi:hypothetical protein
MSQRQTRKQKILGDVKKKRRQRTTVTWIIVVILIAVIVGGVYAFIFTPRDTILIPGGVGFDSTCARPLHTHDTSGTLHVETDVNQNYTISDFFLIWGKVFNGSGIFPSTQPLPSYLNRCVTGNLLYHSHPTLTIRYNKNLPTVIHMTVNGSPTVPDPNPNLQLPHNAATSSATCTPGPSCVPFNIEITYGPGIPASF